MKINLPEKQFPQKDDLYIVDGLCDISKAGETYDWNGLRFEVLKMDRARIAKIRIKEIDK